MLSAVARAQPAAASLLSAAASLLAAVTSLLPGAVSCFASGEIGIKIHLTVFCFIFLPQA